MARKANQGVKSVMAEGKVHIKWVKKANQWCKTWFEGNKQMQAWSQEKPNASL